ncbi:Listeria/Bacterioides repeat-containing protein [Pseudobutyrivibrio sp. ACV-2]|uniref:Ig-like domain-containing protein n=1 Tax=Pseudobutyrivibrio sp. ACV-2 TaxID=1520801 RepID=UPI000898D121|nr:Ig-like domain-containing protein [Pseudobutyrivibrio sp. ACV-2]SEB06283.1 Listeria/Bacterioides repeat-containing protein [Pseudobutyrivibrio sp. ACV-2]
MMKKKKAGRVLLSFLLSLAMVIGFMPGMGMTAHAEEPTEELLTTITGTGGNSAPATSANISYSTEDVAILSFSGSVSYRASPAWGWWGYGWTATVTPSDEYTITKCVFYDDANRTVTDSEAPFVVETTEEDKTPRINGTPIDGGKSQSKGLAKIEVYGYATPTTVDVTGVSLNKTTTTLTVGDTETLTATVSPDDASNKSVTWSSSDTAVATVENGVVTAVGSGTANITVTATNGTDDTSDDKTATCAVTVNAAIVTYAVTLNANGGTINSGNITEYTEGTGATLPTDVTKDGHQFGGWYDNAGLTGSPVTAISTSDTGNKEYWAKWTANPSSVSYSVVFKVVNGSWDDGNTSDKSITLSGMEGDTLKLSSGQIPAVGTKPNDGYKAGSWDVTPSTDTAISSNVTYTYTYVADSSGGTSDSGRGDSSGGLSDSGSGDSSGGLSDSGSGDSSGGSSDSGSGDSSGGLSDSGSGDSSGESSDSGSGSSSSGSTDSGSGSSSSSGSSDSGNTSGETSSGSSDNTNTNTDTSAKVSYDDVAISAGSVNDITGTASATAESNPFGTKIENNSNLTTLLSLTDAEVAQGVNVWLGIQDMSASVPQADKTLIQNTSGDYTVGLYLDINLFKKVGSNDATKVNETNGKVKASILIPESLWKIGRTFEIIRVHDGVATAIAGTYDENKHVFTFETDKFSTYALAYKDPASSSDSGTTSDSSSSNSSNSTQSTAPKTGDPNDVRVWYLLLIASLGGLGFLGYSKKKKVND